MKNIKYINQEFKFYGDISENHEQIVMTFFEALGFDVYYSKSCWTHIKREFPKEKELIHVLKNDSTGIPDLLILKNGEICFIEVKKISSKEEIRLKGDKSDSLRHTQLKWIQEHPQFKVIIFNLILKKEQAEKEVIKELKKELKYYKEQLDLTQEKVSKLVYEKNDFDKKIKMVETSKSYIIEDIFNKIISGLNNTKKEVIEENIEES